MPSAGIAFILHDSKISAAGEDIVRLRGTDLGLYLRPDPRVADGVNKFSFQYGTGPAMTFTSGFETVQLNGNSFIRADESGSWRVRVTENFTASPHRHFALGPVLIAQATSYGSEERNQYWLSAGIRPIINFNRYFNVALEGGIDWVSDDNIDRTGTLYKLTVAPQVSIDRLWASRPVVRAFATFAHWTDDFVGSVGGLDYATNQNGMNWGLQMEAWW